MQTVLENHPEGLLLSDLAGALRVSIRSVRRYLRELDKSTKLEAVDNRHGPALVWRIKPTERGRAVMLRRTQAYGVLAVRRVFEVIRGSALYDELDVVNRQLLQLAHRPTHLGAGDVASDTRLETRLLFLHDAQRSYAQKGAEIDDLFRATADLRIVTFVYAAPAPGAHPAHERRVVLQPYALIVYRGTVHAIGYDVGTDQLDVFVLDRVRDTAVNDTERFLLPNDFDVDDFVHGPFGVAPPGPRARVLLEFDATVGDQVRAQRVHPTQRIAAAPDGRVRLSMTVPLLPGLSAWILSFGAGVRVVEPVELREAVMQSLRGALAGYR